MRKVKQILIIISLTISESLLSQINMYHKDGTRHGLWEKKFEDTNQIRYNGKFDHGVEVGEFKFYKKGFPNHPTAIKKFSDKGKVADIIYYTQSGKIISEGRLINKKREGKWKYYHNRNGNIMMIENYVNDVLDSIQTTYYENKKVSETIEYINGKKEGKQLIYSIKGVLIKEFTYKNNLLDGINKFYNGKSELTIEGNFSKNKKTGIWKYYENGKLIKQKQY